MQGISRMHVYKIAQIDWVKNNAEARFVTHACTEQIWTNVHTVELLFQSCDTVS